MIFIATYPQSYADLRLDNRRGWVRVRLSYVLALWVNTHSLVVLPSQICHAIPTIATNNFDDPLPVLVCMFVGVVY